MGHPLAITGIQNMIAKGEWSIFSSQMFSFLNWIISYSNIVILKLENSFEASHICLCVHVHCCREVLEWLTLVTI